MHTQTSAIVSLLAASTTEAIDAAAVRAAIEHAGKVGDRGQLDLAAARLAWWRAPHTTRERIREIMRAEVDMEARNDFRRMVDRSRGR